jgi:branched-chain amino acid aminotransferase
LIYVGEAGPDQHRLPKKGDNYRVTTEATLRFGTVFSDHMFLEDYDASRGWVNARIEPYHHLSLDPAAAVLHYGQEVFDGLKAFRGVDDRVRLFRPREHAERLVSSARRLCIPPLDVDHVVDSFVRLVSLERDWVPRTLDTSLYVRPAIIATEPFLGVRAAATYLYYVILSPAGPNRAPGSAPIKILVAEQYVRAVQGGVGAAKTGGNYAASLLASEEAQQQGCDQVLWLDGVHRRYLDEVGTMNIMLRIGDEVLTPPLSGTILAGVTRDSTITLLRDWGIQVSERPIDIDEVVKAASDGSLREVWGTGTAAGVLPVGELGYDGRRLAINDGQSGEWTRRLADALQSIRYGMAPDPHQWMLDVESSAVSARS